MPTDPLETLAPSVLFLLKKGWHVCLNDIAHLKFVLKSLIRSPTLQASGYVSLHGENWKIGDRGLSSVGAIDLCGVILG